MPEEEEVKGKSKSKQAAKTHWFCKSCGNDFWGAKKKDNARCPVCGEDFNLIVLNKDGVPLEDVRRIIESRDPLILEPGGKDASSVQSERPKLTLDLSRDALSRASELSADMFERDVDEGIREQIASNIKAKALKSKRELLEEQKRIKALQDDEETHESEMQYQAPNPQGAVMLMQTIAGLPEEQQEQFFERIKDPQVAHNLALILNPPKQTMYGVAPPNPYTNPMGMALQSVMGAGQQPVTTSNPESQNNSPNISELILSIGDMMKTMQEMTLKQQQPPALAPELKEILTKLEQNQEKLREYSYELRAGQAGNPAGTQGGGGGVPTLTKEDIAGVVEKITDEKLKDLRKSPVETLSEVKNMILEVDKLRDGIKGELPEQSESFDVWRKKQEILKQAEIEKKKMELELKKREENIANYNAASALIQDSFQQALLNKKKEKEEKSKEEPKNEEAKKTEKESKKKPNLMGRGAI